VTAPDCRTGLWLGVRIRDLGDACSAWHRPRRPPSCPSGMRAGTLRCKVAREYWWDAAARQDPNGMGGRHEEVVETHPWRHWDGIDLGSSLGRRWHDHDAGVSAGNR
jgi:hypothetical protein